MQQLLANICWILLKLQYFNILGKRPISKENESDDSD